MRFKEIIIVVLIMLIFAMAMLIYMIISDSIGVSTIPVIGNIIENIANENKQDISIENTTNEIKNSITNEENIDLVPSNIELEALEASMINFENRENILRNYISKVKDDYDYILIDCRPSLGLLTINALASADSVVIPIQPQYLALKGMTQLVQAVDKVRVNINPKLKIEGILLTLADMITNLAKTCEETVRRNYGGRIKVFKTVIPRGVKAAESTIDGKSIYAYDKKSKPAIAYEEFAKEVLKDSNRERFRTSECR